MTDQEKDRAMLLLTHDAVHRIERKLFGNGQPGELHKIDERIAKLESWYSRVGGAAGLLAAIAASTAFALTLRQLMGR